MPEKIVKQQYIALAKLLKSYHRGPQDRDLLKASLYFCKNLYAAANDQPDLIFAQPQLYKPQLPYVVNLTFNSCVLTCLVCIRNKFDPAVTIQLMCASLSIYALSQSSIEAYYQTENDNKEQLKKKVSRKNKEFIELLTANQQHIWLSNYQLCSTIHLNVEPVKSLINPCISAAYIANKLAIFCTPNKTKPPISFAHAILQLSLKCHQKSYALFIPLLKYPSITPPGSYIRLKNGSVHVILSLTHEGLMTKTLPTKQSTVTQTSKMDIQNILAEEVIQNYPSQQLSNFMRLSQWWGADFNEWYSDKNNQQKVTVFKPILPTQSPPASLLVIQDQLTHNRVDKAVIIKAIEEEPTYAQHLQVFATSRNRQKQPVKNIQHSLAMLGFERANSILLQHSLLSRLNQQYFPLQQTFLAFSHFFAFIAGELAVKTKTISTELANTTAYFMVSRLFTLPAIRTLAHIQPSKQPTFKVASLVVIKDPESLKKGAFLLANAWQQNKQILKVLQHYDLALLEPSSKPSTRQLCYLLGLSLSVSQEYYFSKTEHNKETNSYLKAALSELNISQTELTNLINNIISNTNVISPLE